MEVQWLQPGWLLGVVPALVWPWVADWCLGAGRRAAPVSAVEGIARRVRRSGKLAWRINRAARMVGLTALVLALAQPVRPETDPERFARVQSEGRALMVALDRSSSMNAPVGPGDQGPSRFEAARIALAEFIAGRPNDVIGLVGFAALPDLAAVPSLDRDFLRAALVALETARPLEDGTNLGDALALAADALRDQNALSKVVALVTDGRNSPALPDPLEPTAAAELLNDLGITLHILALGTREPNGPPAVDSTAARSATELAETDFDSLARELEDLARRAGGQVFEITNPAALRDALATIERLETSALEDRLPARSQPLRPFLLIVALVALALETFGWRLVLGRTTPR